MFRFDSLKAALLCLAAFCLISCGGGGGGGNAAPPQPSGQPQQIKAFVDLQGMLLVTWEAPPSGADGYDLQARIGSGAFFTVNPAIIPGRGNYMSYQLPLTALAAPELTDIAFKVRGYKGSTLTGESEAAVLRTPLLSPSVTLTTADDGIQRLSWTNGSKAADHLELERFHSFDLNLFVWQSSSLGALPVGTTSFVDDTPPEGATVYYIVRYSKGSEVVSASSNRCFAAYRPPTALALGVNGQQVTLSWTNHSLAATKLVIRRNRGLTPTSPGNELITLPPTAQTWVDTVPAPGFYTYSVEARTELWSSVRSGSAMVVTLPPANTFGMIPSIHTMPNARHAVRGDSGAWYFAQEFYGLPRVYLPGVSGWETTTPDGAAQLIAPFLALDPQERPHSVFLQTPPSASPQAIMHGSYSNGAWQTEEVARRQIDTSIFPGVVWRLDQSGHPHLLWAEGDYTKPQNLQYARKRPDGTWAIEAVTMPPPDQHFHASSFQLFIDGSGTPHALVDDIFTVYHLVRTASGTWTWENLYFGQASISKLPTHAGFGEGPADFTLFLQRPMPGTSTMELFLLSQVSGVWQAAVPISPIGNANNLNWARSRTGDRMAFYLYASEGTKLVVGANGTWTTHLLDPVPSSFAFPAFDPNGHLHLLCQASQVATGTQVNSLNVLYDEVVAGPLATHQP